MSDPKDMGTVPVPIETLRSLLEDLSTYHGGIGISAAKHRLRALIPKPPPTLREELCAAAFSGPLSCEAIERRDLDILKRRGIDLEARA